MSRTFTEGDLGVRARDAVAAVRSAHDEPTYARPRGASPSPPEMRWFKALTKTVPDSYMRRIVRAYEEMAGFAETWWPWIIPVVQAEPGFEWLMHADLEKEHYRDHLVHQVRVAAVGDILLDQEVDGQTILSHAVEALRPRLDGRTKHPEEFVRLAWWLTALFHDCGYPCQFHLGYARDLRSAHTMPTLDPSSLDWADCRKRLEALAGPLTRSDEVNCELGLHAYLSAAELAMGDAGHADPAGPDGEGYRERRHLLLSLAVRAILSHHAPPEETGIIPDPINFRHNPLGYLLVLSDEIHEMERPCGTPSTSETAGADDTPATIVSYGWGDIYKVEMGISGRTLMLAYHTRRKDLRVNGRSRDVWRGKKAGRLNEALRGPAGLFTSIEVDVFP